MKKIISLVAVLMAASTLVYAETVVSSQAQNDKTPVAVNRFIDNWFVSAGAGVNTIIDNGFIGKTGIGVDAAFGKWLVPWAGFRFGYHGLSDRALDIENGWFAGDNTFGYHFAHFDLMWDVLNSFRYNQKRLVSIVPMLEAGAIITTYDGHTYSEFGFGGALQVGLNITKRVRLNVEATATLAREEAWRKAGSLICFAGVTGGVQVAVGRVGFAPKVREVVRTEKVVEVIECNHDKLIADLRAQIDSLKALADVKPEKKTIDGWVTYFVIDKSNLLERERYHLIDLVSILPNDAVLTITGHADKETGSTRRNERLSKERVETVYSALRKLGFQGQIKTEYKGDTANPFSSPYPKNRCVTISVTL